jgi:hypothetical protein
MMYEVCDMMYEVTYLYVLANVLGEGGPALPIILVEAI